MGKGIWMNKIAALAALALILPLGHAVHGAAQPKPRRTPEEIQARRKANESKKQTATARPKRTPQTTEDKAARAKKASANSFRPRTENSPTWSITAGEVVDLLAPSPANLAALRRAIEDLSESYPGRYNNGSAFLKRLTELERTATANPADPQLTTAFSALRRDALLSNPLLDFDRLLLVKRADKGKLGLPQNWQGNCALPREGYDNEIATLDLKDPAATPQTLYRPARDLFVGDVDLHFGAGKMLFSSLDDKGRWQVFEIKADGTGLRQVTDSPDPDVDNYDPCYLPDGRILFDSTRCFQGVPCVTGSNTVANLCLMDADGKNVRMLCFDQDHDWCPTVMPTGRILYTRWEYSDTCHYFSRLLFQMNPDGTNQREFYGSNSFWPNSTFYARPMPGSSTKVAGIISGHHGVTRMGELVIFDAAKGRREESGIVQRIPGWSKPVEPVIADQLVASSWPKFLHPYPLSEKYILVSCKPAADKPWGLYLADVFDNIVPIGEVPGCALFEPLPFRKTVAPPVIPDQVNVAEKEGTVYLQDIYRGDGLKGVPRGTVKNLRLFEFYYTYPKMGGHKNVGVEGPWDVHRILGTVPVQPDGSAVFKVPANTPIAIQPLDEKGRALQIMRSWFVAMPGEKLSCVGCHEQQNMAPPAIMASALQMKPETIKPWYGPARGFSFSREVQPALDRYCVGCHYENSRHGDMALPDFTRKDKNGQSNFTPSYLALHPFVYRPGPESDYHICRPMEFHASASELIQMLEKGHHGVRLDAEAMDRLVTWIDLNVPDKGTWGEHKEIVGNYKERRMAMMAKYAGRPEDPEAYPIPPPSPVAFVKPRPEARPESPVQAPPGWPMTPEQAVALQQAAGPQTRRSLDLGGGITMEMALIPAGEFVMGRAAAHFDEWPACRVKIDAPFWMSTNEVTNAQFNRFDPAHDSRYIDQQHKDHTTPGYPANEPSQPVIRVSWDEAIKFSQWLSRAAGRPCALPTEAQWEWACRAGSGNPFSWGGLNEDYSKLANLADRSIRLLAVSGVNPQPIASPSPFEDWLPKDLRFNDGNKIECAVGAYQPNAWGLRDMHGNVAEWTLSLYKPYPYAAGDGREDATAPGRRVVRGGSWIDRPQRATASYRLAYERWQPVYNAGFRVICPAGPGEAKMLAKKD